MNTIYYNLIVIQSHKSNRTNTGKKFACLPYLFALLLIGKKKSCSSALSLCMKSGDYLFIYLWESKHIILKGHGSSWKVLGMERLWRLIHLKAYTFELISNFILRNWLVYGHRQPQGESAGGSGKMCTTMLSHLGTDKRYFGTTMKVILSVHIFSPSNDIMLNNGHLQVRLQPQLKPKCLFFSSHQSPSILRKEAHGNHV